MTATQESRPSPGAHRFVVAYLVVLVVVWAFSVVTWRVGDGATPSLHPIAQVLQFLLVVVAGMLAALYLRSQGGDPGGATFGWYDRRWTVSDDIGARTLWPAVLVGGAAMLLNVLILVVADQVVGGGAGSDRYLEWVGAGIGAGLVLGSFGALAAAGVAAARRLARR